MTKGELLSVIGQKKEQVNIVFECIESLNLKNDILPFYEDIIFTNKYIDGIIKNITDDIVPETFYNKVYHNIEAINISNAYNICNSPNKNVSYLIQNISQTQLNTKNLSVTYNFFKDLGFFSENLVVVGANGSGKSTLATNLKSTIDERDGIVIPAQKLLIVPTFDNTPNFNSSADEYSRYQSNYSDGKITYNASQSNDIPYHETQKYGAEYKFVLKTLLAERGHIQNIFCTKFKKGENIDKNDLHSKLDKAIEIWNSLIEHREMFCNDSNELMIKDKDSNDIYPAFKMSDGEKNILYLIGRVLLSNNNALIIIDEPEMYLHKVIVNKLWDKLELERYDCLFIYITHDLDFASSRKAKKYWIKNYTFPSSWEIEAIPENEIPENLLMKLLGSRKKILFCEGKVNSLDVKIFEILFSEYTITPLASCTDVINYVRAFNKISNKNTEAIGIIDRDFRVDKQLQKFETENIYTYSVAEIENLFIIKDFISLYAQFKNEIIDLDLVEEKVIKLLEQHKDLQISNYLSSFINYKFSESHVKKGNTLADVNQNLTDFINVIEPEKVYQEREMLLDNVISNKDYSKAIMIYNNKGLLGVMEDLLGLKPTTYRYKALEFLKINESAQQILKSGFPNI